MKNIIKILTVIIVITVVSVSGAFALECEMAIEPQFSVTGNFSKGIALVSRDGESAVIDRHGKLIVEFDKRVKSVRSNGLIMIVGENELAAIFDSKGKRLTEYVYDAFPVIDAKWNTKTYNLRYDDGDGKSILVPFSRNKKYGYINSYGVEVIPPVFEYAYGFRNGLARICADGILSEYGTYTNGKYGFIKENGEVIVPADSYWVASVNYDFGYSTATNGEGDEIIADKYGNVSKTDEIHFGKINADYIQVWDKQGRKGITDKNRSFIIPLGFYDKISRLSEECFIIDGKRIVNSKNETVYTAPEDIEISEHYLWITEKSHFARLVKPLEESQFSEKLFGLVNAQGRVILEPSWQACYDLGEGLIYAQDSEKNYLFDYDGKLLCILNGNDCGRCIDGLFAIRDFDTMKKGYMLNPLTHPKVYVNGEKLVSDVYPKIEDNRTLVPMRAIFEAVGAEILWDGNTRTVTAVKDGITVTVQIGSNILYKNGAEVILDVPAKIEEERTLVPLRAVTEALGGTVEWNGEDRTVNIKK